MPIYKGSAFRQFLIDRFAMGFSTDAIKAEFKATQGLDLTDKDIESILGDAETEIKDRERAFLDELSSSNFFATLHNIKAELQIVRAKALEQDDFKSYAQLTNTAIKSVEVLMQVTEAFKRKLDDTRTLTTQNNFYVLNVLEKDGIITITDAKRLKELYGPPPGQVIKAEAEQDDHEAK